MALFNHIRIDDRSYGDSVKVYLKNVSHGETDMKAQIQDELIREPHLKKKKGFFAHLFGGVRTFLRPGRSQRRWQVHALPLGRRRAADSRLRRVHQR